MYVRMYINYKGLHVATTLIIPQGQTAGLQELYEGDLCMSWMNKLSRMYWCLE